MPVGVQGKPLIHKYCFKYKDPRDVIIREHEDETVSLATEGMDEFRPPGSIYMRVR